MAGLTAGCHRRDVDHEGWPSVSVVMPIRNEAEHLERAVASVLAQEYPVPFDICLAVAPSTDGTEQAAAELAAREQRVSVVHNPAGVTPTGLNAAIAATTGEVVVRVDGHSVLSPGYVRRAVETMVRTGAVNVGGRQVPAPETPFEEAVAAATSSWLGTGGATYRVGGAEGSVDTVYLGVFDRAAGDAVGWFADDLVRNQDYELNTRLREAGGVIWFDPELAVRYRPRGSWRALAKQYYEYGYWKAEVVRRHPASVRARQIIPFLTTLVLVFSLVGATTKHRLVSIPIAYLIIVTAGCRGRSRRAALLATIHLTWGMGFGRGLVRI